MSTLSLTVNGKTVERPVDPRTHLADFLREDLYLTGTHLGCEHGVCGACTVLVNGAPTRACLCFAVGCDGDVVTTIEGLKDDRLMERLRQAFKRHHALQCGYCTPGMLITAHDIVRRLPDATEERVREELSGNLCRCTGYVGIVAAIVEVLGSASEMDYDTTAFGMLKPIATTQASANVPPTEHVAATGASSQTDAQSSSTASAGQQTVTFSVPVHVDATTLWTVMREPERVVACMPGARLKTMHGDGSFDYEMVVAIGPMRPRFAGVAKVNYHNNEQRGRLEGTGQDSISRTTSAGTIDFAINKGENNDASLALTMAYKLKGPLAQFARPRVVETIALRLISQFVANLQSSDGIDAGAQTTVAITPAQRQNPSDAALRNPSLGSRLRRWWRDIRRP